ncbi:MAG: hypothetical protein ABGX24_02075 [Aquificota bacterium]
MEKLLINLLRIGIPLFLAWKFFKPDYHILDNLLKFLLLFSIWGLLWEFVLLIVSKLGPEKRIVRKEKVYKVSLGCF